jgi:hypothetical protein
MEKLNNVLVSNVNNFASKCVLFLIVHGLRSLGLNYFTIIKVVNHCLGFGESKM